jgi:hypothetical protein
MVPGSPTTASGNNPQFFNYSAANTSSASHQQPSAPQSTAPPYVPLPGVIEQNEMFDFALKAAPNILFARYKQYGQVSTLIIINILS